MKIFCALFLLSIYLFFCSCLIKDDTQIVELRVNHYRTTGLGEGLYLTFLVQQDDAIGTDTWKKFYSTIDGFNYQPGFIYDLKVLVEPIDNPPADASSFKYTLQKVQSTQVVDIETQFEIDLKISGQSFISNNADYKILNEITIDCNTLCKVLDELIQNHDHIVGTFKRISNASILLLSVKSM